MKWLHANLMTPKDSVRGTIDHPDRGKSVRLFSRPGT